LRVPTTTKLYSIENGRGQIEAVTALEYLGKTCLLPTKIESLMIFVIAMTTIMAVETFIVLTLTL